MKKVLTASVLSISLMAASTVASASDTLPLKVYGKINLNITNSDKVNGGVDEVGLNFYRSRVGVKGGRKLSSGLKAIYQYEFGTDEMANTTSSKAPLNTRIAKVGLGGTWGMVEAGHMWTPTARIAKKFDIFYSDDMAGMGSYLSAYQVEGNKKREANQLIYTAKTGFYELSAGIQFHDKTSQDAGEDEMSATIKTRVGDVNLAGMVWQNAQNETAATQNVQKSKRIGYGFMSDWSNGPLSIGISYITPNTNKTDNFNVGVIGTYNLNPAVKFKVSTQTYTTASTTTTDSAYGFDYKLGKGAKAYGEYIVKDATSTSNFAAGLMINF